MYGSYLLLYLGSMENIYTRRKLIKQIGSTAGLLALPAVGFSSLIEETVTHSPKTFKKAVGDFIPCLNMATIMGQNLGFIKELEVASKGGFNAVEIWIPTLQKYLDEGGTINDASKAIKDLGLSIENTIGFAQWIVDDEITRNKGLEQLKKEMGMLAELGCKRIAAPPAGATAESGLDLYKAAERYRTILELGDQIGVVPQLEIWGHSKNLHKLSQALFVASESGHPAACINLDIFHLYKGGSSFDTLSIANPLSVQVLHVNDYPEISRGQIKDADRIYPGDGLAPTKQILQAFQSPERPLILSLELFNKEYWAQDPLEVCKKGLSKIKEITDGI